MITKQKALELGYINLYVNVYLYRVSQQTNIQMDYYIF